MSLRLIAARFRAAGFTLVEIVVALSILLILAAVAVPTIAGVLRQQRLEDAATQLAYVRDALFKTGAGNSAFFQAVGSNAGRLSELVIPLNTSLHQDSCATTFTAGQKNAWPNGGPYVNFLIDSISGMATPIGQAQDAMVRAPAGGGGGAGTLRITFNGNVELIDAQQLDSLVEAPAFIGWNVGTVQWTPQFGTAGLVTLHYFVQINATC